MNSRVLEAIKKSAAVPSVPTVVTRFLEIMQDANYKYEDLVKVLSSDAGTVSEILRLVNSALFGVRQKIVSLQQALTLLGPKRTRSLLLGRYLVDTMSKTSPTGLDMSYFWRRSLACSVVASRFADKLLPKFRDEIFIGALLADIGIPILADAVCDHYGPIAEQYAPRGRNVSGEEEIEAIEATHAQVSAMILKYWTLPDEVAVAVNLHQSVNPGPTESGKMARIINGADRISKLLCEVPNEEEIGVICTDATTFVGVDLNVLVELLPTIEQDLEELADVLRIDVIPSTVYSLIAKTIQEQIQAPV